MPLSLMILLITLIIGGSFLAVNYNVKSDEQVLSEEITVQPSPTNQDTPTPTPVNQQTLKPTTPAIAIPTPSPTLTPQNFIDELVYPNSKKVSGGENSFVLESNDDSDVITNWYKDVIRSLGMNVKTFVTTKTNGKVLNKLAGTGSSGEVTVEISKSADSAKVEVRVDRQ